MRLADHVDKDKVIHFYLHAALWAEGSDEVTEPVATEQAKEYASEAFEEFASVVDSEGDLTTQLLAIEPSTTIEEFVGYNLYFTTAGHGVGFWSEGYGELGIKLSDICRSMHTPYVFFDDGFMFIE